MREKQQEEKSGGQGPCARCVFRAAGAYLVFLPFPRLAPLRQAQGKLWAAFLRRFAAGSEELCSTAPPKFQFSRTHLKPRPFKTKSKGEFFSKL